LHSPKKEAKTLIKNIVPALRGHAALPIFDWPTLLFGNIKTSYIMPQ